MQYGEEMNARVAPIETGTVPDLRYLRSLKKRAIRAKVWHKVEAVHRAAIDVVKRVLEVGEEGLVTRIKRSIVVGRMVKRAVGQLLEVLQEVPWALPYRLRAMVEGTKIVRHKIGAYRERGVFLWVPWLEEWLRRADTVYFLGSMSLMDGVAMRGRT